MDTYNKIVATISKYNNDHDGQVNLGSPHARADLAELIYNTIMKQTNVTSTYNSQSTFKFSNKDDVEHK